MVLKSTLGRVYFFSGVSHFRFEWSGHSFCWYCFLVSCHHVLLFFNIYLIPSCLRVGNAKLEHCHFFNSIDILPVTICTPLYYTTGYGSYVCLWNRRWGKKIQEGRFIIDSQWFVENGVIHKTSYGKIKTTTSRQDPKFQLNACELREEQHCWLQQSWRKWQWDLNNHKGKDVNIISTRELRQYQ